MFYLIFFCSAIIFLILQGTIFTLLGIKPDLILVSVVSIALLKGSDLGATWGLIFGLLEDLLNGRFLGACALSKMITGFLAGYLEKNIFKDNPLVPFVCMLGFTIFNELLMFFLLNAFRYQLSFLPTLAFKIFPLAIYNAIFSPLVFFALYRLDYYFRERYLSGS